MNEIRVNKLKPEHTKAGIKVSYDDPYVMLTRNGDTLQRKTISGYITPAVWTNDVRIEELIKEADLYMGKRICRACSYQPSDEELNDDVCPFCGNGFMEICK